MSASLLLTLRQLANSSQAGERTLPGKLFCSKVFSKNTKYHRVTRHSMPLQRTSLRRHSMPSDFVTRHSMPLLRTSLIIVQLENISWVFCGTLFCCPAAVCHGTSVHQAARNEEWTLRNHELWSAESFCAAPQSSVALRSSAAVDGSAASHPAAAA